MPKGYRSSRTMEVPGSIASSSARALKVPANHAPERTRYTSARQWGCLCYADGRGRHAGDVTRLSGGWEGRGREAPPYPDSADEPEYTDEDPNTSLCRQTRHTRTG
jgi:hypothetical protein